jgi:cystathionine gamma-lyase
MSLGFSTRCIHAGQPNDEATGAVAFPIYQTSTYAQEAPGVNKGYCYSRTGNPTRSALEANLASLEEARYGLAFSSGLAAANCVLNLLKQGDHVIACQDLYGGSYRLFTKLYRKFGIEFDFVPTTDAIPSAIRPSTKLLWLESPSNPLLRITDLRAASALVKPKGILTLVDNTFATPYLQKPLQLGADIVLHSTTKYLGGHSDVIGGALVTNEPEIHAELAFYQNAVGAIPGPQDCFLVLRGTKTLALRMERHCASARAVASFLEKRVGRIHFPGRKAHPGHEIARAQMKDFGAIVSFELEGEEEARRFLAGLSLWTLGESLGGVKSLLCHPPTMTHASVEPEVRRRNGIGDGLLRLSVGIEDVRDLIADLDRAFLKIQPVSLRAGSSPSRIGARGSV